MPNTYEPSASQWQAILRVESIWLLVQPNSNQSTNASTSYVGKRSNHRALSNKSMQTHIGYLIAYCFKIKNAA
jgi:hypothetical protein